MTISISTTGTVEVCTTPECPRCSKPTEYAEAMCDELLWGEPYSYSQENLYCTDKHCHYYLFPIEQDEDE